jgi:peptide/nickel transport system substrate-binding protein
VEGNTRSANGFSRRKFLVFTGYGSAAAFLAACGASSAPGSTAGSKGGSKLGGSLSTFASSPVGVIDPTTTQANDLQVVAVQLYGNLVRYETGSQVKVIPDLASRWTASSDGLTYTFYLRSGGKFHDGSPITVNDVVASLAHASSSTSVWESNYSNVASVTPHTSQNAVTIKLSRQDPFFLEKLATIGGSAIYPEAALKKFGSKYATTVETTVGSGPYQLVTWNQTQLVFKRFADYYNPANINEFVITIIPDPNTEQLQFQAGQIDWFPSVLSEAQAKTFKADPSFKETYKQFYTPDAFWYGFNPKVAPFNDIRVRQAIAMSIDMAQVVKVYGLGTPTGVLLNPNMPGYDPKRAAYSYDPQQAQKLLSEAGVGKGLKLNLSVWNIPAFVSMSQVVIQQLNQAGFDAQLSVIDFATFISEVPKGAYSFFINLGNIFFWDPAQWLFDSFDPGGPFDVNYSNPQVNSLLSEALQQTDITKRAALAGQAEALILKDFVAIPIMHRLGAEVFQPWVQGVETVTPIYPNVPVNELWIEASHR